MTFGGNNNKMEYPKKIGVNFVDMKKIAKFKKGPTKFMVSNSITSNADAELQIRNLDDQGKKRWKW